jgi:hypothetical protein
VLEYGCSTRKIITCRIPLATSGRSDGAERDGLVALSGAVFNVFTDVAWYPQAIASTTSIFHSGREQSSIRTRIGRRAIRIIPRCLTPIERKTDVLRNHATGSPDRGGR